MACWMQSKQHLLVHDLNFYAFSGVQVAGVFENEGLMPFLLYLIKSVAFS